MVNYPHKVAKKTLVSTQRKHPVDFANRGMTFEKMINESNQYYLSRGLAEGNTAKAIHADEKFSSTSDRSYGGGCPARRYLFRSLAFCKVE